MITLFGFRRIFPAGIGETKDLRVEWALKEIGLPYRVHGLDHTGGELDDEAYRRMSCFRQVPVIDDDGFVVAESGAILLYLAEKAGKLIPADFEGRTRVVQWCFAAVATVQPQLAEIQYIDETDEGGALADHRAELVTIAKRWLDGLEDRLADRTWIAGEDFTVADILLATVLRLVRKTDLLEPYPRLSAYFARALARPAWQSTVAAYAQRLGVDVSAID
jgi:glutathione S-transferase